MSDSEFSFRSRSPSPVSKKRSPKLNKKSAAHSPWDESVRATPQPQPTASRRKAGDVTTSEPAGPSKRKKTTASASKKSGLDLFQIINEEESCAPTSSNPTTTSSFASRVSSGTSRRTVVRTGEYFIDLKVYKVEDLQKETDALERYKKALVAVRLQCEEKSLEWVQVQSFLSTAFELFKDSDPTYFNNTRKQ